MCLTLTHIAHQYQGHLKRRYGSALSSEQWSALNAILGCRTGQYGAFSVACPTCEHQDAHYHSCGHRFCNQCQNHVVTQWLERQRTKLLPATYFMVTFTLPAELRGLARSNPTLVYGLMFDSAVDTLRSFGRNDKHLAGELAMTAVLHTHSRRLDYHPHVHLVVPGGAVDAARREWRKVKNKYLFNHFNLARVFRRKLLAALQQAVLPIPTIPDAWVADCKSVGSGLPALQYLSRYLYRGVIRDRQIVENDGRYVTFEYKDSESGTMQRRRMEGEDFLKLILQHVLPKRFRRARDYGFLHGNAKRLLRIIQWALQLAHPIPKRLEQTCFFCPYCQSPMRVTAFFKPGAKPG